ncbi:MAG: hypothetical protein AAF387_14555 [Pseudomonadota bacterium]
MSALELFEALQNEAREAPSCDSEAAFKSLWRARDFDSLAPLELALQGGACSSILPWVFTVGYQATLRNAFPQLPKIGWAAFVATEDQHQPDEHPGTRVSTIDGAMVLEGHKSWVAHSRNLDTLIVTINDEGGDKYKARGIILAAERPGITLSHREQPRFLGKLSQGYAKFSATPIEQQEIFDFESIRQFGRTEAKFVMLASVAFMMRQLRENADFCRGLLGIACALEALISESETSRQAFAAIDTEFQHYVAEFEREFDVSTIDDYAQDKRLLTMYSARIQRRAKR